MAILSSPLPRRPPRVRRFNLITYLSETQLQEVLHVHDVRWFAYAYHDKDVKEDGSPKESHCHVVLVTENSHTETAVKRWFTGYLDETNQIINTRVQQCVDLEGSYRYLTHLDNPDKFQYDSSVVVCSDEPNFETLEQPDIVNAVMELIQGDNLESVMKRYGRDFVMHFSHIRALLNSMGYEFDHGVVVKF